MTTKAKVLTAIAILLVLGGGYAALRLAGARRGSASAAAGKTGARAVPVSIAAAASRHFEDSLRCQGSLKAKNYALVSPRVPGVLEGIFVREGHEVVEGQTKLFQTDSLKLTKALEIARQNSVVARCAREEREAYAESVEADLRKAESDCAHYKTLDEKKVISHDAYEERKTALDRLQAVRKHAASLVALAREEERKAATAVEISEKDLRDSVIAAPISGKVTRRMAEPGEMGAPGVPVVRIEDGLNLEAAFHLPSQYYAKVQAGRTKVRLGVAGRPAEDRTVSYKSPAVDPRLRTFEVKCDVPGNADWAVPGALIEAAVVFSEKNALAVPAEAVLQRAGRKLVFVVDGGAARLVPVETGLETDGWTEVAGKGLSEKSGVVVQGQFLLNDGSAIAIQKGSN